MRRSRQSSAAEGPSPAAGRRRPGLLILAFCAMASGLPSSGTAADKVTGHLWLQDALTVAGKPVRIEARLVRTGLMGRSGLGGEQLELLLGEQTIGRAMTGGDGRAFFAYTCRKRGTETMTVRLAQRVRVESAEAVGTLACWERRRPILLVDVAVLVKEPSRSPGPLPLPLSRDTPEPEPDAAEELKRLTEYFFNVAYLAWPGTEPGETPTGWQAWLRAQRFPLGPVLPVEPGPQGLDLLLDRFKADGWENVKSGIGRTKAFAEALVNRRMEVVIVPARDETLPRRARVAKDWKEVRKRLRS